MHAQHPAQFQERLSAALLCSFAVCLTLVEYDQQMEAKEYLKLCNNIPVPLVFLELSLPVGWRQGGTVEP